MNKDERIFDVTFYDERIDYYMDCEDQLLLAQEEYIFEGEGFDKSICLFWNAKPKGSFVLPSHSCTTFKGYGEIDFDIDVVGLRYILNFWKEAKEWYIQRESKRMMKERDK